MITLKNTTDIQILFIERKSQVGNISHKLTDLDVEYTENGQYSIQPPAGYAGLTSVDVKVDVQPELEESTATYTENGQYVVTPDDSYYGLSSVNVNVDVDTDSYYEEGRQAGIIEGKAIQKSKLESVTFSENGSYNKEDGWNSVQVNVDTETPYVEGKEDGIAEQKAKLISGTFNVNGTYTREDGYNEVNVNVPLVPTQSKSQTYTENGTYTVVPDTGYNLDEVEVNVDVDLDTPYEDGVIDGMARQKAKLTSLNATTNGNYTREDGYNEVTVNVDLVGPYNEGKTAGIAEQKAKLESTTLTENGTYNREDGWNQVAVDVDLVTPYNNGVAAGVAEQKAKLTDITIVSNGNYTREDGYNDITVAIPSDIHNQDKSVTYTANGTNTVIADSDYSGLGQVTVTVDVDLQTPYDNGYADGEADGIAEQKAKLTTLNVNANGTYTREDGYSEVTVDVDTVNNQSKTATSSTTQQVITPDSGYTGLSSVTINPYTLDSKNVEYTQNDTYTVTSDADGLSSVNVTVNVDTTTPYNEGYAAGETAGIAEGIAEQKAKLTSLNVTSNGTYNKEDGYNEVNVNVQPNLESKSVSPSTSNQVITPSTGYDGLSSVSISAVDAGIDSNIQAGNILDGITILGVTGTVNTQDYYDDGYVDGELAGISEQKAKLTSINISSNGYYSREDGYNSVTVDVQPSLQAKTATPSTNQQIITSDSNYYGLSQVTVNAVTASIDNNITAGNIKKDVSILGVTGTYDPQPDLETKSVTYTTNDTYVITPTTGKDGISEVTVTVDVAGSGGGGGIIGESEILTEPRSDVKYTFASDSDWTITVNSGGLNISPLSGYAGNNEINVIGYKDKGSFTISNTNNQTLTVNTNPNLFYIEALEAPTTISWSDEIGRGISYSSDGETWTSIPASAGNTTTIGTLSNTGDKLYFKADNSSYHRNVDEEIYSCFNKSGGTVKLGGNLNSLLDDTAAITPYCFYQFFTALNPSDGGGITITDVSSIGEYERLFYQCTALVTPPIIKARSVTQLGLSQVFSGCSNLATVPELPATTLGPQCYDNMFRECTSIRDIVDLPATTLAYKCYRSMFYGCTGLIDLSSRVLPAPEVAESAYEWMFSACTNLTKSPIIKGYALNANSCYEMFAGCTNLVQITSLNINGLNGDTSRYYNNNSPTKFGTFYKSSACREVDKGSYGIPYYWAVENFDNSLKNTYFSVEAVTDGLFSLYDNNTSGSSPYPTFYYKRKNATTWSSKSVSASGPLNLDMVAGEVWEFKAELNSLYYSSGKYYRMGKNKNVSSEQRWAYFRVFGNIMSLLYGDNFADKTVLNGTYTFYNFLADNPTLLDASRLLLPATTITNYCYYSMFHNCYNLRYAPELPATTLANYCYYSMFENCSNLISAPVLRAKTLVSNCYTYIFRGCDALENVAMLSTTTPTSSTCGYWISRSSSVEFKRNVAYNSVIPTSSLSGQNYGYPAGSTIKTVTY